MSLGCVHRVSMQEEAWSLGRSSGFERPTVWRRVTWKGMMGVQVRVREALLSRGRQAPLPEL